MRLTDRREYELAQKLVEDWLTSLSYSSQVYSCLSPLEIEQLELNIAGLLSDELDDMAYNYMGDDA